MLTFLFAITGIGSALGSVLLIYTLASSQSAPQQAAGAAISIGLAIIPYVFSRCVQIIVSESHRRKETEQIVDQLKKVEAAVARAPASTVRAPVLEEIRAEPARESTARLEPHL